MDYNELVKVTDNSLVPIDDGLGRWVRELFGGKPSKELVHRFTTFVKERLSLRGGSKTKGLKTYLGVEINFPERLDIGGVEVTLHKVYNKDGVVRAYYQPQGGYKRAETQEEDTL